MDATQKVLKPIEEAPFGEYLRILRENGYKNDADISEQAYIGLLTSVTFDGAPGFTKEQVYAAPFKNVLMAAEKIVSETQRELSRVSVPVSANGPVMVGKGAEKLTPEELNRLAVRQIQLTEEERDRIGSGRR